MFARLRTLLFHKAKGKDFQAQVIEAIEDAWRVHHPVAKLNKVTYIPSSMFGGAWVKLDTDIGEFSSGFPIGSNVGDLLVWVALR